MFPLSVPFVVVMINSVILKRILYYRYHPGIVMAYFLELKALILILLIIKERLLIFSSQILLFYSHPFKETKYIAS